MCLDGEKNDRIIGPAIPSHFALDGLPAVEYSDDLNPTGLGKIETGIIEPMLPKHEFYGGDLTELLGGMLAFASGILFLFFSEIVGVALAIEKNTRKE